VVGGSILVGVAVVPAQAAALVEALLAREDAKKKAQMTTSKRKSTSSENVLALDTEKSCPKCGASFHWAKAQYCYSCGEEL
jgi:predicted RNA-binding Zn-ribbon protein involved in translation (DUF1610 family)